MPKASFPASMSRLALHFLMACATLASSFLHAQGLAASFNTPADIPVTTPSYTASGEISVTLGFAPTPGTNLTIIKNTGLPFITGQFSNLANGATVNLNHNGTTYPFVAWYYGGEGNNDLVLLWPYTGLAAWGGSYIGDGSTTQRLVPAGVLQSGILLGKTIVQLACGGSHRLALCSDGTLVGWGGNETGQLGDNSTVTALVPVAVSVTAGVSALAGKTVVAIAAGTFHSLALCSDGTLAAWGWSTHGQLGDNSTTVRLVPVAVNMAAGASALAGKTAVMIAAGRAHSLALCSDGTLATWGRNLEGQLGDNTTTQRAVPVAVNVTAGVSALAGKTVVALSAGLYHSMALCSDGVVTTWGGNANGQVGDNSVTQRLVPVAVNVSVGISALAGKTVVAVAAGGEHNLALCGDGTVGAWGDNFYGQLGDNSTTDSRVPVAVNVAAGTSALAGKSVLTVGAGERHGLALCSDGTLTTWGDNDYGQLGDNSTTDRRVPVAVNMAAGTSVLSGRQVSDLSIGSEGHKSSAIYGTTLPEIEVEVLEPSLNTLTDQVSTVDFGSGVASWRTFRVRNSGGLPLAGVSASLSGTDAASFTLVSRPSSAIVGGDTSTFQVASTGLSPGAKSATLEITSNDSDESPFRIALVATKTATLTASFSTANDIPLSAPAINLTGAEVNLSLNFAPTPGTSLTVIKNTGPAFIKGQFSNLANGTTVNLTHNGTIYPFVVWYYGGEGNNDLVLLWPKTQMAAWGANGGGQLGDNSTTDRSAPVNVDQSGVLLGKTIVQVARGASHSLALCSDGTLAAWGANSNGQLGDNSTTQRQVPVLVDVTAGTSTLAGKTVVAVAAGGSHSLALCSDGTVAAWGGNGNGQLGDNSTTNRLVPVAVNVTTGMSALAGKAVVALSACAYYSLALCSDGTVAAWGANSAGQLGDNSTTNRLLPVAVNAENSTSALAGKTVIAITAADSHSLALCSDGTLAAWGNNLYGALGDDTSTNRQVPVKVMNGALLGKSVVAIASRNYHSMALCSDGSVAAWGDWRNGFGYDVPREVMVTPGQSTSAGKSVVAIAAGNSLSLALCRDGTVVTWDNPNLPAQVNSTAGISALAGVQVGQLSVSSQGTHSIAIYAPIDPEIHLEVLEPSVTVLTDQGSTVDFGSTVAAGRTFRVRNTTGGALTNISASLIGADAASFSLMSQPTPAIAGGDMTTFLVAFNSVSPGAKTATLEITSNDSNENPFRIALVGTKTATLTATFNAANDTPLTAYAVHLTGVEVELELNFSPAPGTNLTVIKNMGPAFLSGQFSNLVNGTTVNLAYNGKTYPFVVWYYGGEGNNDLMLLWPYTELAAWGNNSNGQLGDNSTTNRRVPVEVEHRGVLTGKTIVQVARGASHSLALCSDGTVAAWGRNTDGQLGDNSTTDRLVPVVVNSTAGTSALAGKTVVAVTAGNSHSLALCVDGTLVAWGRNTSGQLGDNSTTGRQVPVAVNMTAGTSALANKTVVAIATGNAHSLALCSDGTVVAWGSGSEGQLGNNSAGNSLAPVAVNVAARTSELAGKTVVAIAAGGTHSLALCSDGRVVAWGNNDYGKLGNDSWTNHYVPVGVNVAAGTSALAGKTVVAIAAGNIHSLALCSDGTVTAWGYNYRGELGNNSTSYYQVPVAVSVAAGTSTLAGKTVVAIAAASSHSLALCSDGTMAAWGYNGEGQLGDDSQEYYQRAPVAVNVVDGTSALAGMPVSQLSASSQAGHSLVIYGTTQPEIEVEVLEPSVTTLADQVSTVDFGSVVAAGRTFRVRNTGGMELKNLSASLTGTDAASFTVLGQPTPAIARESTSIFQVALTDSSPGTKSAILEITSNDNDENPFRIALVATKTAAFNASFAAATDTPLNAPAINLTGAEVNLTLNFAPTPGTNLTVIKNTGLGFITGQFSNLANGTKVNLSYNGTTYPYVAWYFGGEGNNDLVLLWPHTGLAAWGYNNKGQLGNNSSTQRNSPVGVVQTGTLLGKTIVQVARGDSHSLALCSDGTMAAWGDNSFGQLGDSSTTTNRLAPVAVTKTSALTGKTVVAIAAGAYHSLALCSDGTVAAWGRNTEGALGNNSTSNRDAPVTVNVVDGTSALAGKKVVGVAAGGFHSLVLCSDGTVATWGYNLFGQLGENSTTQRLVPVAVNVDAGTSALSGKAVVTVAAGAYHSLALCSDGTVAAWGKNGDGQLGFIPHDQILKDELIPVAVYVESFYGSALAGKSVVAVAAGLSHSLALCSDGTVAAWGRNADGQLGTNDTMYSVAPAAVNMAAGTSSLAGKSVAALSAGYAHSLTLCSDGTIAAWGANYAGQLGDNSTTERLVPVAVNVAAGTSVLSSRRVTGLAAGPLGLHSIAIYGAPPTEIELEVLEPTPTALTDQISTVDFGSAVAAGRTFRVRNTGGVALANHSARVTGADAANFTVASQPSLGVAVGETTSFLVGFTGSSQGTKSATLEITSDDIDENPFRIALVGTRTATLTASFSTTTDTPLTAPAVNLTGAEVNLTLNFAPTPGTNLTVIKNTGPAFIAGNFSNLANGETVRLNYNGRTYWFVAWYYGGEGNNDLVLLWPFTGLATWGDNSNGQLGTNSITSRLVPVDVDQSGVLLGKTIVQVSRGTSHSLALCSDGTVAAWGANRGGQLGDNSTTDRLVPVEVNRTAGTSALKGKTVVALTAGNSHSLALCSDGTVAAWGNNAEGQLGDNSTTTRLVPVAVMTSTLSGKTVVSVAAGESHSLALCSDGTVAAWGGNNSGQLGINSKFQRRIPVAVNMASGLSELAGKTVISVAAGSYHSLALCSDGTMSAWGYNLNGQLGDNSTSERLVPVSVVGTGVLAGKKVAAIAAGGYHCLALCTDGTVAAWGYNNSGQLGNNSTTQRQVPVGVNTANGTIALFNRSVVAVAAGGGNSLALCSDGMVAAWGYNNSGQLGDNSTTMRLLPTAVNVTAGISSLAGKPVSGLSNSVQASHNMAIFGQEAASQITVAANGIAISPDDRTPSVTDLTDFGKVGLINAQMSHTFTIAHQGNAPLRFTGSPLITLSGSGAHAFAVQRMPAKDVASGRNTSFVITFDPRLLGLHTATVTIQSDALNHPNFTFDISGFGILSTALKQTITFTPPATVNLGQSPLNLSAYSSSGLPVTLSVVPSGTTAPEAAISGDVLSFTGPGSVKVQAVQAGGGQYAAAATLVKTITVRANPTTLTLLNLAQTFAGTPRNISTLGGFGSLAVEYKIGTTFGSIAPTNAGSYPVRATDSMGTKTGTLVITKAPLYVTPADQRKFVGQDNPPLTLTYSGWVNGESATLVTKPPALKTTATKTSPGGIYPITVSGGVAPENYVFIFHQGALVVDSFAASYEALLADASDELVGKLAITISAANTSFTGKLFCVDEKTALSLNGSLLTNSTTESSTGTATVTSGGIPYVVSITLQIDGSLRASVTRYGLPYTTPSTGRRLLIIAAGKTILYSGAHTAVVEPATPAGNAVPAGAGWSTAAVSSNGLVTLAGKLGDGTSFTTTLSPDDASDPTYRLFLQPYKTGVATRLQSYLGGAFTLLPHPTLTGRRYVEAASLSWAKAGLTSDTSYSAGFGPVSTVMMLDPWLAPATGISLATRLGLTNSSFQVLHSDTGSTLNGNLPTRVALSATNLVSVITPSANATKWKATLVPTTGTFTGSFELSDTTPKPRVVPFSGVLRQPATQPDGLIGDGHYLLPPITGTGMTTGEVMFKRP